MTPLRFAALDDGRGGIELHVEVDAVFRSLPADERERRYGLWLGELRERERRLPAGSDERTGLALLRSVAERVSVLMQARQQPPASLVLAVGTQDAAEAGVATPAPPGKH